MNSAIVWKPLVRRASTGRWQRLTLRPQQPTLPSGGMARLGLYLHVPFCKNLCPFCPYHRVQFDDALFDCYERAVHQEINLYAPHLRDGPVASLYIGGGTPTVHLDGLVRLIQHISVSFRIEGDICIELHPAHVTDACLGRLRDAGVTMLSIGAQSTSDRLLQMIGRTHDATAALEAVRRACRSGFRAVNVDLMFALPTQTLKQWTQDVQRVLREGVDQISTYPLFGFPYSDLGKRQGLSSVRRPSGRLVRRMLNTTDRLAEEGGLRRCAVWSWLRPNRRKFSSVTRHYYVGFGPSAGSMIGSHFYVNTFDIRQYAATLPKRLPIAVALPMSRRLEMVYWLYWRLYELHAEDADFAALFGADACLKRTFGHLLGPLCALGWIGRTRQGYRVTHKGAYWVHRLQNEYSLDYITRLWGRCRQEPWPREITL